VIGNGITYNKGKQSQNSSYYYDWEYDNYAYESSPPKILDVKRPYRLDQAHYSYMYDFSTSFFYSPDQAHRFSLYSGMTFSKMFKNEETYTVSDLIREGYYRYDETAIPVFHGASKSDNNQSFTTAQAGVSFRFGGKKAASQIAQRPELKTRQRNDSLASLYVRSHFGHQVRINGVLCTDRANFSLTPGNYYLQTIARDGKIVDSRVISLKAGSRIQYYVKFRDTKNSVQAWF